MATDNQALFSEISAYLAANELSSLFSVDANGVPSGWLWDQITSGVDSAAALLINLEATQPFQQRYGVIAQVRAQAAQGKAVHVPTVKEVREYEQQVATSLRAAGLPEYMWDNWQDTHQYMLNGLSPIEVEQRLGQAWERVQNTDPLVRQEFSAMFGTLQGDAALAATFLDPQRTLAALDRQSRAAFTRGQGLRMGLNIDAQRADRIAGLPKTDAGIMQDLTQLNALDKSGIMTESIGERANDLTTEGVGVDSVVFGDGAASGALERRVIERQAARAAVPGGALRTNRGLSGVGTANN